MKSRNLKNKLKELNQKSANNISAEVNAINPPKKNKQSNNDRLTDDKTGKGSKKPIKEFNKLDKLDSKSHPMHRDRSRTKQILNKFNVKIYDREDNSRARVKSEVYADKKGQEKLKEIKEIQVAKRDKIEEDKKEELRNFPGRVVVQFTSAEGKNLGGSLEIETNSNKLLLNQVINKLKLKENKDESNSNHLIMVEDTEISETLKSALIACYNNDDKNKEKKGTYATYFDSESVVKIVYHPENLYTVKPLTRGGQSLEAHTDSILTCMFSPCGKFLASGGGDSLIRLWDMDTFTLMMNMPGHDSWVMNVSWSPCGEYLVSGGLNGKIVLVKGKTGEIICDPIRAHKGCVTTVGWKPLHLSDEPLFITSGKDGSVRCYNALNQQTEFIISAHNEPITKVIWSGENVIYTCSRDKLLKSFSDKGEWLKVYEGHGHWINTMSINTEFILRTGFYDYETRPDDFTGLNKMSYLEKGTLKEKKEAALKRYNRIKSTFNFSHIDRLVTGSDDFSMFLWSPQEKTKPITRMTGHNQLVNHVMFSPNTMFIASGSFDKSVKLWNGHTGKFICNFFGHIACIYQISWSADSKFLLSACKDSTVKIWNIKSEKSTKSCRSTLPGHADEVYCIDWSPDGNAAASGGKDKRVNIWKH
jgi:ribosome assembly protein 4